MKMVLFSRSELELGTSAQTVQIGRFVPEERDSAFVDRDHAETLAGSASCVSRDPSRSLWRDDPFATFLQLAQVALAHSEGTHYPAAQCQLPSLRKQERVGPAP